MLDEMSMLIERAFRRTGNVVFMAVEAEWINSSKLNINREKAKPMKPPKIPRIKDSSRNILKMKEFFAPKHFMIPITLYLSTTDIIMELNIVIALTSIDTAIIQAL